MTQRAITLFYAACLVLLAIGVPMLAWFILTDIFQGAQ
jgi:hypothetical protein